MSIQLDAPAIGFRSFWWNGGPLLGVGFGAPWPVQREPQIASCAYQQGSPSHVGRMTLFGNGVSKHDEDAPVESCQCGIYAHSTPERVPQSVLDAVTIGYGRLVVHPDGWRAEKCEIVGLIAPAPTKCKHDRMGIRSGYIACENCGKLQHEIEQERSNQQPSLAALEILAEQYGTRVIPDWDAGVMLAEELGAKPIPDEVYAEAAENAPGAQGGEFVSPMWFTGYTPREVAEAPSSGFFVPPEFLTSIVKTLAGHSEVMIELVNQVGESIATTTEAVEGYQRIALPKSTTPKKPSEQNRSERRKKKKRNTAPKPILPVVQQKREKREAFAGLSKPKPKAA